MTPLSEARAERLVRVPRRLRRRRRCSTSGAAGRSSCCGCWRRRRPPQGRGADLDGSRSSTPGRRRSDAACASRVSWPRPTLVSSLARRDARPLRSARSQVGVRPSRTRSRWTTPPRWRPCVRWCPGGRVVYGTRDLVAAADACRGRAAGRSGRRFVRLTRLLGLVARRRLRAGAGARGERGRVGTSSGPARRPATRGGWPTTGPARPMPTRTEGRAARQRAAYSTGLLMVLGMAYLCLVAV